MNTPFKALNEMKRLSSPFPESVAVKEWKAGGQKVIGCIGNVVVEEMIRAAGMLPFQVSGDNEQVSTRGAEGYLAYNTCSFVRSCFQLALDRKYAFLDGLVTSQTCECNKRLHDNWLRYTKAPYMDILHTPRKRDEDALQMYLADLEGWRTRLSAIRGTRIVDSDLREAIRAYNRGRELLQILYELRKRDRPPISGAESLEVVKAATRLPRGQFNQLLEQLLEEIDRSGREIRKGKRLMLIGSDVHNSAWIEAIEELDAVVVTDELYSGTRYFWGEVDTTLPPMEALARYYMFVRPPEPRIWPSGGRFQHIFEMAEQYKVDGGISEIITFCAFPNHDKLILKDQMTQRGIPMLELDLEYGQGGSGQFRIRAEAFLEMLQNRAQQ